MTDHLKRHGQTDKNQSRHVMLRQEIESYPVIIGACAHNKDNNKKLQTTDEMMHIDACGGRLVHKPTCCRQWGSRLHFSLSRDCLPFEKTFRSSSTFYLVGLR